MSASPTMPPRVVDPEQVLRGLHPLAMKGGLVLSLAVTLQYAGQWRLLGWVFLASAVRFTANGLLARVLHRRFGPTVTEWSRLAWNLGTQVAIGLGAGWSGSDPMEPLAFSIIGVLGFLLTEKRAELLQQSLEEIIAQREQLSQAQSQLRVLHDRAMEQEKFSSLGMMAAGVAHEINNPMAFVTSNVNSLFKELKQQPALPGFLNEYVEDVLPATLDGIKRVNAIVSDLRHFARGDVEAHAEYDLNTEAMAAMRLAQGQLAHVEVELELGEVGVVVGRPRQIVQVLMNLSSPGRAAVLEWRVSLARAPVSPSLCRVWPLELP